MRRNPIIVRSIAALLLLIFLQKSGAGLFVHNLLHSSSNSSQVPSSDEQGKEITYACSCIDDFLMPFTGTDEIIVSPLLVQYPVTLSFLQEDISCVPGIFTSLRGPPLVIA